MTIPSPIQLGQGIGRFYAYGGLGAADHGIIRFAAQGEIGATISLAQRHGCDRILRRSFLAHDGETGVTFSPSCGFWRKLSLGRRRHDLFVAPRGVAVLAALSVGFVCAPRGESAEPERNYFAGLADEYRTQVRPLVQQFCLGCHSTAARVGEAGS